MPRHFRPFARRGSEPPESNHQQDSSRVRSRLHALFSSHSNSNSNTKTDPKPTYQQQQRYLSESGAGNENGAGPSSLTRRPTTSSPRGYSVGGPEIVPDVQTKLENRQTAPFHNDTQQNQYQYQGGQDVMRSKTFPIELEHGNGKGTAETLVIPSDPHTQRDAIKVLVVTWNMGDALPKGDLSVIFGQIPPFQPESPTDKLPSLPVENAHPYHIVVVAGQECPTLSGAPRGLGGGLVKGVTLRHRKDKEKAEKEKEKDKEKNPEKEKEKEKDQIEREKRKEKAHQDLLEVLERDREDAGSRSPDGDDSEEDDNTKDSSDQQRSRATSPMTPHTPFLHRVQPPPKGWSQMLDDYFCGPNARTSEPLPTSYNSSSPFPRDTAFLPHPPPSAFPTHPSLLRSASAPITPVTAPVAIPPRGPSHGPSHLGLAPSPLARSRSSFESASTSSSSAEGDDTFVMMGSDDNKAPVNLSSSPQQMKVQRPEIIIPNDEISQTGGGNGSYVHVVKERLLGMYLSIYVYKGCEHLVQGMDKDLVTAGLAGGRVGNKGGIGISLKLADHRFLFVNSHLAAHTGRLHARLSNIAKIKSELRLDCFLPKDDPRAELEDITERFDTTFWCGDLNFRLELSRLHADWLIEQKKYSELLMWDQLKLAMQDPKLNPFPGFEEANIDFPCTFKYDVWKSVRATNRDVRRTIKRRQSTASAASIELSTSAMAQNRLSHVPEGDSIEEVAGDANGLQEGKACPPHSATTGPDNDDNLTDVKTSRRSCESSRYTSAAGSTLGTDYEDDSDDGTKQANQNQRQHRAFEVALKEKTRHFLEMVKMDGILNPSPGKRGIRRRVSARRKSSARPTRTSAEFDPNSRRTSMSSFVSRPDGDQDEDQDQDSNRQEGRSRSRDDREMPGTPIESFRRVSMTSTRYEASTEDDPSSASTHTNHLNLNPPLPPPARSDTSWTSSPPRDRERDNQRQPFTRRLSIMKRTQSNKSVRPTGEGPEDPDEEEDDQENEVDNREGIYDSSKKQRVPSWCDRVLWKAHVEPDPENSPVADDIPVIDSHTPFHRLSAAFSNFGGHLKLQMTRSPSIDPGPADRLNLRVRGSGVGGTGNGSGSGSGSGASTPPRYSSTGQAGSGSVSADTTFVASPPDSPDLRGLAPEGGEDGTGLIPAPKRASPLRPTPRNDDHNHSQGHGHHIPFSSAPPAPPHRSPTKLISSLGLGMSRSGSAPGHSTGITSTDSNPNSTPSTNTNTSTTNSVVTSGSSTPTLITQSSPDPPRTKLSFDPSVPSALDRLRVTDKSLSISNGRPRRNSDSAGIDQSKEDTLVYENVGGIPQATKKGRASDGLTRSGSGILSGSNGLTASTARNDDHGGSLRIFDADHGQRIKTISHYDSPRSRSPSQSPKSKNAPSTEFLTVDHAHSHSVCSRAHDHASTHAHGGGDKMPRTTTIHTTTHPTSTSASGAGSALGSNLGSGSGSSSRKDREREMERNGFIRFLKDLPSWLHRSSSGPGSGNDDDASSHGLEVRVEQEKVWKKGEVRCLHYGTIDDVGMRLLEGRSDHRPAIFAGAVYV